MVLRVDVLTKGKVTILAVLFSVFLIGMAIVGLVVPHLVHREFDSLTRNSTAPQIQMGLGDKWTTPRFNMTRLHRYLTARLFVMRTDTTVLNGDLPLRASLYGGKKHAANLARLHFQEGTITVACDPDPKLNNCSTDFEIHETDVCCEEYYFEVQFPGINITDPLGMAEWFKGVMLVVESSSDASSILYIAAVSFYFVVALVFFILYWRKLAVTHNGWDEWDYEQKLSFLLFIALLIFESPLKPLEFAIETSFWSVVAFVTDVVFYVMLVFFWLALADRLRKHSLGMDLRRFYLPKIIVTSLLFVLLVAYSAVTYANSVKSAIRGSGSLAGLATALLITTLVVFVGTIIWIIVIYAQAHGVVKADPRQRGRFILLWVPMAFIAVLQITLLVTTSLVRSDSMIQFMLPISTYNCYCFLLVYMYWPMEEFTVQNTDATEPLDDGDTAA